MASRDLLALSLEDPHKISREPLAARLREMSDFNPGATLDVGAGELGYRELFAARSTSFISVDFDYTLGPTIAGSALALPLRSNSFDTLLSTQTLEHLPDPRRALEEFHRVLRANGRLLLSAPQSWPMHMVPHDYYRYTRFGLEWMLAQSGFSIERIEPCGGAIATVGQYVALGIFHLGATARHSRTRRLWRRRIGPLVNRVTLWLDRRYPILDGNVLNWVVLARRM
jgi:SAM-dependent methyltransferase